MMNVQSSSLLLILLCSFYPPQHVLGSPGTHYSVEDKEQENLRYAETDPDHNIIRGNLIEMQFPLDEHGNQDKWELVLDGELSLIDVNVPLGMLDEAMATFCKIDTTLPKEDPSKFPTYADITSESDSCIYYPVSFRLRDIAKAARIRDASSSSKTHSMKPKGFIFHQPHSGSSLLANAIAVASPKTTHVVSQSNIVSSIFSACDDDNKDCDTQLQIELFHDAVYLLGRTTSQTEQNLYIREPPTSTIYLNKVRQAFPNTKWVFIYRDANTILTKAVTAKHELRVVLKNRMNALPGLVQYVSNKGMSFEELNEEQLCSALFGTLLHAASKEHNDAVNSGRNTGRLVSYDRELMNSYGIHSILDFLEVDISEEGALERIETQRRKKSNGGRGIAWQGEDNNSSLISNAVVNANSNFLQADMDDRKL